MRKNRPRFGLQLLLCACLGLALAAAGVLWICTPRSPSAHFIRTGAGGTPEQDERGSDPSGLNSGEVAAEGEEPADEDLLPLLANGDDFDGGSWIDAADFDFDCELEESAAMLLEGYEAQEGCALMQAGFLDLFGDRWACIVRGDGWVEICFVSRIEVAGGGAQSHARVVRMGLGK